MSGLSPPGEQRAPDRMRHCFPRMNNQGRESVVVIDRKIAALAFAFSSFLAGCGGGGAATDSTGTERPPADETPGPGGGPSSGTVVVAAGTAFTPATVNVAQGASVTWQFSSTHNVTFGSAKPSGGDIPNTSAGASVTRTFSIAGTYDYDCTLHSGMSGSVVVQGSGPAVFTSVAVSPSTPSVGVGATVQLSAQARDQNGNAMSGLPAATWTTSSNTIATVSSSGLVTGIAAGQATITASMTSAGTTRTSSATVTVTTASPNNVVVTTPGESFAPRVVSVAAGSTVTWQFSGSRHNVTFGSLQPAGGNIPDTDAGNSASRVFANAGTYDYQCTRHDGMTGQVVVGGSGTTPTEPPPGSGTLVRVTSSGYSPERAEIAPGGAITWEFTAGADGIVFDDESPPGGNIPETTQGGKVSRTFPAEGDYDYYSLKDRDKKGRIRVR
jgi:plastocyanin